MKKPSDDLFDHLEIASPQNGDLHYLLSIGFTTQTVRHFLPFIQMVRTGYSGRANFKGIGFPYHASGDARPQGFEVVNYGFTRYIADGEKTNAVWCAELFPKGVRAVHLFIAGSAIEAMSFFELNRHKYNFDQAVFVSAGQSLSDTQIRNVLHQYPYAKINTIFSNDIAGNLFDIRVAAIQERLLLQITREPDKVTFRIPGKKLFDLDTEKVRLRSFCNACGVKPKLRAHKPPGKNFNAELRRIRKNAWRAT